MKLLMHTHELNTAKEQDKRLLETLSKKIPSVAEGNTELCLEFPEMDESLSLLQHSVFSSITFLIAVYSAP